MYTQPKMIKRTILLLLLHARLTLQMEKYKAINKKAPTGKSAY